MPLISELRRKDSVAIKSDLSAEDKAKLVKFASRISKNTSMGSYAQAYAFKGNHTISEIRRTTKDKTEYALLSIQSVQIPVQTRYLTLVERKPAHKATKIFA